MNVFSEYWTLLPLSSAKQNISSFALPSRLHCVNVDLRCSVCPLKALFSLFVSIVSTYFCWQMSRHFQKLYCLLSKTVPVFPCTADRQNQPRGFAKNDTHYPASAPRIWLLDSSFSGEPLCEDNPTSCDTSLCLTLLQQGERNYPGTSHAASRVLSVSRVAWFKAPRCLSPVVPSCASCIFVSHADYKDTFLYDV